MPAPTIAPTPMNAACRTDRYWSVGRAWVMSTTSPSPPAEVTHVANAGDDNCVSGTGVGACCRSAGWVSGPRLGRPMQHRDHRPYGELGCPPGSAGRRWCLRCPRRFRGCRRGSRWPPVGRSWRRSGPRRRPSGPWIRPRTRWPVSSSGVTSPSLPLCGCAPVEVDAVHVGGHDEQVRADVLGQQFAGQVFVDDGFDAGQLACGRWRSAWWGCLRRLRRPPPTRARAARRSARSR